MSPIGGAVIGAEAGLCAEVVSYKSGHYLFSNFSILVYVWKLFATLLAMTYWGQDYKRFLSTFRCSTHNLCSEMA